MRNWLLVCLALFACAPVANEVSIAIANRSQEALRDVRVVSGGDKVYFKRIDSGAKTRVALDPGRTSDYQVTLFYTLRDHPTIWDGESLPTGNDYFVEIGITQEGIEARHCIQPCE